MCLCFISDPGQFVPPLRLGVKGAGFLLWNCNEWRMYAYIRKWCIYIYIFFFNIYSQYGSSSIKVQDNIHYHKYLFQNILQSLFSEFKTAIKNHFPSNFTSVLLRVGMYGFVCSGYWRNMSPEVIEALEFILK